MGIGKGVGMGLLFVSERRRCERPKVVSWIESGAGYIARLEVTFPCPLCLGHEKSLLGTALTTLFRIWSIAPVDGTNRAGWG
jgi:hypothetical protein